MMPAHPARPRALPRIQPGVLAAAAALASVGPHTDRLADTLWQLAGQAFQQQPAPKEKDTDK